MSAVKDKGTSVLASLTAQVMDTMDTKVAASRQLTPVAVERGAPLNAPGSLPNDTGIFMSNEALFEHAAQLRKFAADAIAIADGIDARIAGTYLGSTADVAKPIDLDAVRKEKEAAADAKAAKPKPEPTAFDADLAAKAAAAQAATFKAPADDTESEDPDPAPAVASEAPAGWVCPTHGKVIDKVSTKTGRSFRGCPECNLFER